MRYDFCFTPLALGWNLETFDVTFTYRLTTPTGRYETGADDNLGLGFWTCELLGFTYYYHVNDRSTYNNHRSNL